MENVYAIIVTYEPDVDSLLKSIIKIDDQCERVIVVDNGSSNFKSLLDEIKTKNINVDMFSLNENVGIATAQNRGIERAINYNADYIVFFDQDSDIPFGFIRSLVSEYMSLSLANNNVAAVGPIFKDSRFGFYYPLIKLNKFGIRKRIVPSEQDENIELSFIISSGMLTSVSMINKIGMMKDDFFIDYVDTEWCLRAVDKGYNFYAIPKACMTHAIGDNNVKFLFWKLPVHSPFRRYYRMRNMFYLFKLPYIPFVLKLREFITNNAHQFIITMISDNKWEYLKSWCKALKDGVKIMLGCKL